VGKEELKKIRSRCRSLVVGMGAAGSRVPLAATMNSEWAKLPDPFYKGGE
jgi:hypothetical protein